MARKSPQLKAAEALRDEIAGLVRDYQERWKLHVIVYQGFLPSGPKHIHIGIADHDGGLKETEVVEI